MTDNSFCIKVRKDVISILEKLEIFQEDTFSPKDHYAESVKEVAREGTHWDIIQEVWKTHSYDLLLVDNSIFQFHKAGEDLRYCFMQNPKVKVSWKEFLNKNHLREDDIEPEMLQMCRGCYDNGDDDSCYQIIANPVYFRYDVSGMQYKEGLHPYSHLHVGLHNEIRLPISKVITPEMFVQFAVKMTYPELWKEKMGDGRVAEFNKTVKNGCIAVPKDKWNEQDKYDLFFI